MLRLNLFSSCITSKINYLSERQQLILQSSVIIFFKYTYKGKYYLKALLTDCQARDSIMRCSQRSRCFIMSLVRLGSTLIKLSITLQKSKAFKSNTLRIHGKDKSVSALLPSLCEAVPTRKTDQYYQECYVLSLLLPIFLCLLNHCQFGNFSNQCFLAIYCILCIRTNSQNY